MVVVGMMVVLGWRRAYDLLFYGLYKPPTSVQKNPEQLASWTGYQRETYLIQVGYSSFP